MILKNFNKTKLETFFNLLKIVQWQIGEDTITPFSFLVCNRFIRKYPFRVVNYTAHELFKADIEDIPDFVAEFLSEYEGLLKGTWKALNATYNPLWNTDATTRIETVDTFDTLTSSVTNIDKTENSNEVSKNDFTSENSNIKVEDSESTNHTVDETAYGKTDTNTTSNTGYNDPNFFPTNKNVDLLSGNDTDTIDGNSTNTGTTNENGEVNTSSNNIKNNDVESNTNSNSFDANTGDITHITDLHKTGNIGVTTSQEMVTQEIILRIRHAFEPLVYKFVENFLLANIYGEDCYGSQTV